MKDGIGKGYTREDHQDLANQLFSAYAKVGEARNLASVIGEDELSPIDKQYLKFGEEFETLYRAGTDGEPYDDGDFGSWMGTAWTSAEGRTGPY
jgi:vacuolar-type H+-ATPase subunit B/Vma2